MQTLTREPPASHTTTSTPAPASSPCSPAVFLGSGLSPSEPWLSAPLTRGPQPLVGMASSALGGQPHPQAQAHPLPHDRDQPRPGQPPQDLPSPSPLPVPVPVADPGPGPPPSPTRPTTSKSRLQTMFSASSSSSRHGRGFGVGASAQPALKAEDTRVGSRLAMQGGSMQSRFAVDHVRSEVSLEGSFSSTSTSTSTSTSSSSSSSSAAMTMTSRDAIGQSGELNSKADLGSVNVNRVGCVGVGAAAGGFDPSQACFCSEGAVPLLLGTSCDCDLDLDLMKSGRADGACPSSSSTLDLNTNSDSNVDTLSPSPSDTNSPSNLRSEATSDSRMDPDSTPTSTLTSASASTTPLHLIPRIPPPPPTNPPAAGVPRRKVSTGKGKRRIYFASILKDRRRTTPTTTSSSTEHSTPTQPASSTSDATNTNANTDTSSASSPPSSSSFPSQTASTSTSTSTSASPVPSHSTSHSHSLSGRLSFSNLSSSMRTKKSLESVRERFMGIRPRVSGVFTPSSLPPELWLLILRYATSEPFVPLPGTPPLSVYATAATSSGSFTSCSSATSSSSSTSTSTSFPKCGTSCSSTYHSEPVSFLTHTPPHTHFAERLRAYNARLQWKAALTRVCRVWNWVGQEVLYEDVWIGRGREGRALAGRLCGDVDVGVRASVNAGVKDKEKNKSKDKGKTKEGGKGLGWFKRKDHSSSTSLKPASRQSLSRRPSFGSDSPTSPSNVGRFIRRLHIETPSMEKCSPHDLLIILQYAPLLEVFEDYRSVRRPMHPLVLGGSDVVPFWSSSSSSSTSASGQQLCKHQQQEFAPDALLHTLLSRPLKKLSWTNYDYDPSDFDLGVRFYEDVVGPKLRGLGLPGTAAVGVGSGAEQLEFLEISLSGCGIGMGGGGTSTAWGVGGGGAGASGDAAGVSASASTDEEDVRRRARARANTGRSRRGGGSRAASWIENPQAAGTSSRPVSFSGLGVVGASSLLTELRADFTTTTTTTTYSSSSSISSLNDPSIMDTSSSPYSLTLPNLRSLKATLDNATFFVLSTWDMPLLSHLSVMSADFGYAGAGFKRFFEVHGAKIFQLELGHSSGDIEEAWVTQPPPNHAQQVNANLNQGANAQSPADSPFSVPLNEWCPNLKEFICSADAEWNWQSPDWIAPHVLLPTHPGLTFIGVRDMERRLLGDADDAARRRRENQGLQQLHNQGQGQGQEWDEDPYFMLLEQFGSLLRKEAFPSLLFVRDMSKESDLIRKTGRMPGPGCPLGGAASNSGMGMDPLPRWLPMPMPMSPYVTPVHWSVSAGSATSSTSSSSSSVSSLFSGSARRFISKASPLSSASSQSSTTSSSSSYGSMTAAEDTLAHSQGLKVLKFWERVLERCRERGVWLEDCNGVNVRLADLRRAAAAAS
ncbi:hypothetical protein CVT26_013003 [Gymnopilus dilepis]|uniref:Uncharacterized protein n=1 Tax=Gymnopilus dilepis TaxID=231916 RepID=A0A409WD57_9AGAR|nr:hypothetical protein CVT26_013003 [Gymnopilus dilepis]